MLLPTELGNYDEVTARLMEQSSTYFVDTVCLEHSIQTDGRKVNDAAGQVLEILIHFWYSFSGVWLMMTSSLIIQ